MWSRRKLKNENCPLSSLYLRNNLLMCACMIVFSVHHPDEGRIRVPLVKPSPRGTLRKITPAHPGGADKYTQRYEWKNPAYSFFQPVGSVPIIVELYHRAPLVELSQHFYINFDFSAHTSTTDWQLYYCCDLWYDSLPACYNKPAVQYKRACVYSRATRPQNNTNRGRPYRPRWRHPTAVSEARNTRGRPADKEGKMEKHIFAGVSPTTTGKNPTKSTTCTFLRHKPHTTRRRAQDMDTGLGKIHVYHLLTSGARPPDISRDTETGQRSPKTKCVRFDQQTKKCGNRSYRYV